MTSHYTKLEEQLLPVRRGRKLSERQCQLISLKNMGVSPMLRMLFYISNQKINLKGASV